eukprot:jgi/Bigna1/90599/estExt_fgenesh1_pg.C_740038
MPGERKKTIEGEGLGGEDLTRDSKEREGGAETPIARLLFLWKKAWKVYPKTSKLLVCLVAYRIFVKFTKRYELSPRYAPKWMSHIVGIMVGMGAALFGVYRGSKDAFMMDIDTSRQYMIVWHPHGAFATIPVAHASYPAALGWFPFRYHALIADVLFELPIIREMLMIMGAKRVNRANVRRLLEAGHNIAIQPGGIYEQLRTDPKQEKAFFPPKLGFIRQAIRAGVPMLPAYLFGENQIFTVSATGRSIGQWLHRNVGVPILAATGFLGIPGIPKPTKIYIRCGRPGSPQRTSQTIENMLLRFSFRTSIFSVRERAFSVLAVMIYAERCFTEHCGVWGKNPCMFEGILRFSTGFFRTENTPFIGVGSKCDNPSEERVQKVFKDYVKALRELFER